MTIMSSTETINPPKHAFPLIIVLVTAGLAGNYFNFEIFLNIDFLFGSIFSMLVLQYFGLASGILAAAVIASYTFIIWNHPYAIIIQMAEVATVGLFMNRRKSGMVLADTLYWCFIGMPLVYLFYHLCMQVPPSNTYIVMIKQAVNGIFNALVARIIFTGYILQYDKGRITYREIIYILLAFFVLFPALLQLMISSRAHFTETDKQIRSSLSHSSRLMSYFTESWLNNRKAAVINLAEMAAVKPPQQMQPFLGLAKMNDRNLSRVGLIDKTATIVASAPLVDELGKSNVGKSVNDSPYLPQLKKSLKPMLSEVVMGITGSPMPRVFILAPVVVNGGFGGYAVGVLDMAQIRKLLDNSLAKNDTLYTLLDKNGNTIMSNRPEHKMMSPFTRGKGELRRLDSEMSQWIPTTPHNTPISERWKKSLYVKETSIGSMAEWKLILEQPVAPFQKNLYDEYTGKLTLLFLILLGSLALAELLSRKAIITIENLRSITNGLSAKLSADAMVIAWPQSSIAEADELISNFRDMASSLTEQLYEVHHFNATLEAKIVERTEQLSGVTSELKIILNNAGVGITLVRNRQFKWINTTICQMFGYSSEELTGAFTRLIYPSHDEYEQTDQEAYIELAKERTYAKNLLLRRSDGSMFNAHYAGKAINPADPHAGSIWIITDETEQFELQEKLVVARDAAESANRAKSEFLANMSHEIRTPMNGVIGMAQLLEMTDLTDEQKEYVDALRSSGYNLLLIINDILDLAKIESGEITIESAEFSLKETINDVLLTQKPLIHSKGLKLNVHVSETLPNLFLGDQLRIKQIINNLLCNAAKFTSKGTISVAADMLQSHGTNGLVQISVRDTGIGIPSEALENIFRPFSQQDSSTTRLYGGTGLGLSISQHLAEKMGGAIAVESESGVGSCFKIILPLQIICNQAFQRVAAPGQQYLWDGEPLRILLVEDNPVNINFTMSLLRKLGHDPISVENGRDCLAALENSSFDLVLMDIQLPIMNGEDALKEIRQQESGTSRHQPVIALTAYSLRGEQERFLNGGFDGYVSKPTDAMELVIEMKKVLGITSRLLENGADNG